MSNGVVDVPMDISQKLNSSHLQGIGAGIPGDYGGQPNIHPGCISSTGRNGRSAVNSMQQQQQQAHTAGGSGVGGGGGSVASSISGGLSSVSLGGLNLVGNGASNIMMAATSTQNAAAQQLIGGAPSPRSLFVQATQHTDSVAGGGHPQMSIPMNHMVHPIHQQQQQAHNMQQVNDNPE